MRTSTTFANWRDRLTYVVAEAQLLVAGVLVSVAVAIIWFSPEIPGIPPIFMGWFAIVLLLGPPLFGFFVWLIHKVRVRNMVPVHHVNAVNDVLQKYYVEPEMWREKDVDGPNPYPVNGGDGWAVQEFDHDEEMGALRVRGVWLEETSDTKLLTKKSHMESIYGKLTSSHIALGIIRDSVSEFGADIQHRLTNRMAEARERGKMMDEEAVKDVFESFSDDAASHGPEDLPTLETEEDATDPLAPDPATNGDRSTEDFVDLEDMADQAAEAAPDGGSES